MRHLLAAPLICLAALPLAAAAQTVSHSNGTDTFVADPSAALELAAPGDIFVTGGNVTLRGAARGDAHVAGFDLDVDGPVGGDLYAAGVNVALRAPVAEDATIAGWSVRLDADGSVAGNARLVGGTIVVDAPVTGALTVGGSDVTIDAAIGGDVWVTAESLQFGPRARIAGRLVYATVAPLAIPGDVIPADRVTFQPSALPDAMRDAREGLEERRWPAPPGVLSLISGGLLGVVFLLVAGGFFLALAPRLVEGTQAIAAARPGRSLLLGIGGLSLLLGLVPVLAITLIGLPLVPFAILLAVVGWVLGYLLGVYALVRRLAGNLGAQAPAGGAAPAVPEASTPLASRILLLAVGLIVAALLNFVPVLGWGINIAIVLLGLGAITARLLGRLSGRLGATMAPPPA